MCECQDGGISAMTISDYLRGVSPLLGEDALRVILVKRVISPGTFAEDMTERELDLAEAEACLWLSTLPVGTVSTKDTDGSWSHGESYSVSKANLDAWYRRYAYLREKWGEPVSGRSKFRIINF